MKHRHGVSPRIRVVYSPLPRSMIKIVLSLIICSQVAGTCLEPYEWPEGFNTQYDCLMFGYEESLKKMKEIGRTDVNQYNMFVKFYCTPENTI